MPVAPFAQSASNRRGNLKLIPATSSYKAFTNRMSVRNHNSQQTLKKKKPAPKKPKQPQLNIREIIENPAWRNVLEGLDEEQRMQLISEYERAVAADEAKALA